MVIPEVLMGVSLMIVFNSFVQLFQIPIDIGYPQGSGRLCRDRSRILQLPHG